jgi:ferredoxin
MSAKGQTLFETFLNQYDDREWRLAIQQIKPEIDPVDRSATQIWFHFFPLVLARALEQADDREELVRDLVLMGNWRLGDQIDSSHHFLYADRFWSEVKSDVAEYVAEFASTGNATAAGPELSAKVLDVASRTASRINVDRSLLTGITAIALMTLQQVGLEAFKAAPGVTGTRRLSKKSPIEILKRRQRDDSQGLFGFLRGPEKIFTVTFNENDPEARFRLISTQHLTTAAAADKRDYYSRDPRCTRGEGPIPVQCRSASCGTCWIGVMAGAEKLSDVTPLERRRIREFGYIDSDEPKPLIRLACRAQAFGNVSIVIPPWNGVFGNLVRAARSQKAEARSR